MVININITPSRLAREMSSHLCEFQLSVHFKGTGLMGGKDEYNPYIGVYGTFGEHKMVKKISLNAVCVEKRKEGDGEYHFDDKLISYESEKAHRFRVPYNGTKTRVDEAIWVELFCHTRDSGISDMDKREAADVERIVSGGIYQLRLSHILDEHRKQAPNARSFKLTHQIYDDKIVDIKVRDYAKRDNVALSEENYNSYLKSAIEETTKGIMTFEIKMDRFCEKHFNNSVYGIKNFATTSISAIQRQPYSTYKMNANRDLVEEDGEFTPISYNSTMGIQKLMRSLETHVLMPYCRHFMKLNEQDKDPLCKPSNGNVANLQLPMWVAKQGKFPVVCYWSCHCPTTREYASVKEREADLKLYGYNTKTEAFFHKLLDASLRRHGMSAKTFEYEINHHFSMENKSDRLSSLFLTCEEIIADIGTSAANTAYYTCDYRFVPTKFDKKMKIRMVVLDSWDNNILNGIGNADDCEGEDNVATTVLRAFSTGRYDMGFKWESSLLNAVKLYLSHSVIYDVGATVTSAYVDTNDQKIDMKDHDLPMIGDKVDLASHCDGHCHGLMGSLTDAIKRMEQGNISKDVLSKVRAATISDSMFQKRDAQRKILVLEPTGSIEPRILPIEEGYELSDTLTTKKKVERNFVKTFKTSLDTLKEKDATKAALLSDMFQAEGLQHYVEKQDPRRRISAFYNEVVHASSVDLWKRFDISLSQFALTRKEASGDYRYGVKIADFIRTNENHAFIFPFQNNREVWRNEVIPMIESMQHQLPIMSFGRFSDEEYEKVMAPSPFRSNVSREKFEQMVHQVASNPNQSLVRLYSRPWKFKEVGKRDACEQFLGSLKGLVAYAFYSEHQIPVCDATEELLCIVDNSQYS